MQKELLSHERVEMATSFAEFILSVWINLLPYSGMLQLLFYNSFIASKWIAPQIDSELYEAKI